MNNSEEIFASLYLNAVEEGAEDAVQYALQNSHLFDKNCVDYKGRSALILAIDNENIDMLHLLIQNDVIIDEAFLHAIDEGQYAAVEVFCKRALYLRARGIDILNCGADSSLSSCDVTPIVKAAQCNELHIIKLLLDYGAVMPDPAVVSPRSEPSSLQSSLTRLHIYQALSSEAYISLTSVDPIGDAFVLSVTLRKLSKEEYEFSQEYEEMSIRCEQFAADLLAQTRDQREIRSVLEYDSKLDAESVYDESVQRVTEAVNYRQKKFIAQAHCQQYLIGQYYKQLKNKVDTSTFVMLLTSFLISISYPVLSIIYLFWPKGKFADFIRIPYIKFLMHAMSYLTFLVLLFMTSTEENNASAECSALYTERKDVLKCLKVAELAQQQRGPPPSILELIIVLWIVGMTWREIKELWSGGVAAYLRDPYNFIDWSQLALYWAVIALRIVAYLHVYDYIPNFATADGSIISVSKRQTTDDFVRKQHNGTRVFTEEQITSVANDIIGTLSSEMQISHERLGESITELSIVLGQILGLEAISNGTTKQDDSVGFDDDTWWQDDSYFQEFQDDLSYIIPRSQWNQWDPTLIAECIFAVANVLSVLRILRLTVISQKIGPMQITLQKIVLDIFKFLFIFFCAWTAFSLGLTQIYWSYNAEAEVQCYQTPNATDCDKQPFSSVGSSMATLLWSLFDLTALTDLNVKADHQSSEGFGRFLYAMYMIIAVIVLLNLLIAIMSNTYSKVQDNSDIEWKFYRAEMWVGYFQEGGTLPVPFNIIPSPKSAFYFLKSIFCCTPCRRNPKKNLEMLKRKEVYYRKTVHQLVERYFARRQYVNRHHDSNPLTLSEFKEFRDEMTSFRKNVQDITTDVMNRISQLEGSLQKTGSVPLSAYDGLNVNNLKDEDTKSRYKTLKQRMIEEKLQIMGAKSTPENIRHRKFDPKAPHSETTFIHPISHHDVIAPKFAQAGPFGPRHNVMNPMFHVGDIELEIR